MWGEAGNQQAKHRPFEAPGRVWDPQKALERPLP